MIPEKEIRQLELGILDYIDKLCKEHKLKYVLDYGTLLGAVRHHGFIPWDDDIDISMSRKDYNKLIEIISKEDSRYKVLSYETSADYIYEHAKVVDTNTILKESSTIEVSNMGVWVDVFPRDEVPSPYFIIKYFIMFLVAMRVFAVQPVFPDKRSRLFYPMWLLARCVGYKPFLAASRYWTQKYKNKNAKLVGCLCELDGFKSYVWDKELFECQILLPFEGKEYPCPHNYSLYLTGLYGEYMKLPPIDKRVKHSFDAFYKSES